MPVWQHTVDRSGDLSTITLSGELDLSASAQIRQAMAAELRQPGLTCLAVDMSAVTFIDSTMLSTLLYARNSAQRVGCRLAVSTSPQVRRRLQLAGLAGLFNFDAG